MGCLDSFKCCSFPHGRDQAVQIALMVSTVAWLFTVASLDAHGSILATISWLFLQSTTCTTLSVTALSCAAMSCLITAAYNVRAIWMIAHIFGECRRMESQWHQELEVNSSATEFNITLEGNETMTWDEEDVEEMDFLCGGMDFFLVFAVISAPLWLTTAVSVFYIPQPSYNNYTTLMDYLVTSPSSNSNNDNEQQQQFQPPQPVVQRLFRGCCRSFAVGSFPHGKNVNMMLVLTMTVLSTAVALVRHRFETDVLAVVATGIVWASTATTIAPVVLHLAAMLGFLTSFFGFQAVYYIRVVCPQVAEHPNSSGWMPDYCQHPTWFTVIDLATGFLWFVTSFLIFTVPAPPALDLDEWGAPDDLALQQDDDDDHVELEDMKAGAMT